MPFRGRREHGRGDTALAGFGRPVLLVDDRIGTGWTMTVARSSYANTAPPAMLPFALAVNT